MWNRFVRNVIECWALLPINFLRNISRHLYVTWLVWFFSKAAPNDIQRLWTAIDRRIQALKRGQNTQANEESSVQGPSADDEEETRTEPDDEIKSTGHEDDDEPAKDRCEVVDKSNNDSCPTGEGRGKETVANDD